MSWFLYIVKCSDETLYTGITTDITRRLKEHNSKKGAFYTQNKTPVTLIYQEPMTDQSQARKREAAIKQLTRKEKLELVGMEYTRSQRVWRDPASCGSTRRHRKRCPAFCGKISIDPRLPEG